MFVLLVIRFGHGSTTCFILYFINFSHVSCLWSHVIECSCHWVYIVMSWWLEGYELLQPSLVYCISCHHHFVSLYLIINPCTTLYCISLVMVMLEREYWCLVFIDERNHSCGLMCIVSIMYFISFILYSQNLGPWGVAFNYKALVIGWWFSGGSYLVFCC